MFEHKQQTKKPLTEKDAIDTFNYFAILSVACLILAGVFMVIDIFNNKHQIDMSEYGLTFLGMICFVIGLGLSNQVEIKILKQRLDDTSSKEESKP